MKKKGVLHRDIKIENIGVVSNIDSKFTVKLLDFGLGAFKFTENQKFKEIQGTPGFIAPEILKKRAYNEKCDIFSLGMAIVVM